MGLNNKQNLDIKSNPSYKVINGVTYFKLQSEFEGDYTKNCGLFGEEIDANFYFLRGYDIESININEDRELIINRLDKDYAPTIIKLDEVLGQVKFDFDKKEGVIKITYPDGNIKTIDGFLVEGKNIKISTDHSLAGNGTISNPLRISSLEATGTYAPVDELFDITTSNKMPDGKYKGHRVITKEKIDNFGCLYPLFALKKIQDKLEECGSPWRIPTKNDWDELLNAMEIEAEYRNHGSLENKWLGKVAGSALKSNYLWENYEVLPSEIPVDGQDAVGLSILPLGIGTDRNEIINDTNSDIEGFKKLGGIWTNTKDNTGNAYVKIFSYGSAQVDQDTYGVGSKFSIRLIKDYDFSNFNQYELILGLPYKTTLINHICDDINYTKIWTTMNVYDGSPALGGIRSTEWDNVNEADKGIQTVYFINEWNGFEWSKKLMVNGSSVVIKNYNGKAYHEWKLIDETLEDTLENVVTNVDNQIDAIYERLELEIENRENSDNKLLEAIQNEGKIRLDVDNQLYSAITSESQMRVNVDKQLSDAIKQEGSTRKTQDDLLRTSIINESELRKSQDDKLLETINKEIEVRANVDEQLREGIKLEADMRKSVDDQLLEAIRNEGNIRKNNDIQPGEYILDGDNNMVLPTFGANVEDVKIKVSSDFFNFGPILNNE